MNVIVYGKDAKSILPVLGEKGFCVVDEHPDFIVTYGGDGTIVESEFLYPGIPKIVLKQSLICKRCTQGNRVYSNEEVLDAIVKGAYVVDEIEKIEATHNGKQFIALNDITIHNADPRHGMRYTVSFDGEQYMQEIIGDGIVVSTPFGSTGYYRSITDSFFEVGIGLAFNNSTEQADHVVLDQKRLITLSVTRGPAVLYADNQKDSITLSTGDVVNIRASSSVARIARLV